MPFDGNGNFTALSAPDFPAVTGNVISSSYYNNVINDLIAGLSDCVTRDGQSPATANLPMGGFKHTGAAAGAATGQYLVYEQSSASLAGLTLTGDLSLSSTFDVNFTGTGDNRIQNTGTVDGADTGRVIIASTGAMLQNRGAFMVLAGNEAASGPGRASIACGTGSEIYLTGDVDVATGDFSVLAGVISGIGSGITSLNASQLTSGTVPLAQVSGAVAYDISAALVDTYAVGYKGIPRITGAFANGQCRAVTAGATINTSDLAIGTAFCIYNNSAAAVTITEGAGVTLRLGGTTTTGNRTLEPRGMMTVWCNTATEAVATGAGVS